MLFELDGLLYYHPVRLLQVGLALLNRHRRTGDQEDVREAEQYADVLRNLTYLNNGLAYPAYPFEWRLHQDSDDVLKAPWYSGMAQGLALSFYVRLYHETDDATYMNMARAIFGTFTSGPRAHDVFTVALDSSGYYWIEEYPHHALNHVLNGFIFGVYGLAEYYWLTSDASALFVLQAALTTLREHALSFRAPGDVSFYCLRHRRQIPYYHRVHIGQLRNLWRLTSDPFFAEVASQLAQDYLTIDGAVDDPELSS